MPCIRHGNLDYARIAEKSKECAGAGATSGAVERDAAPQGSGATGDPLSPQRRRNRGRICGHEQKACWGSECSGPVPPTRFWRVGVGEELLSLHGRVPFYVSILLISLHFLKCQDSDELAGRLTNVKIAHRIARVCDTQFLSMVHRENEDDVVSTHEGYRRIGNAEAVVAWLVNTAL